MCQLQRSLAVIAALVFGVAVYAEENAPPTNHIIVRCKRSTVVHVRIFDTKGNLVDEFEASPAPDGTITTVQEPIEASKRYVVTSATTGCVRGESHYTTGGQPINLFKMPCNSDAPLDLVVTSDPPATFKVLRVISEVCRSQRPLNHGSTIAYFTSDETLTIDARSIADPLMTGRLVLDWNVVPRARQTIENKGYGAQGGSGAAENAAIARRLKTFTIEPKVSP